MEEKRNSSKETEKNIQDGLDKLNSLRLDGEDDNVASSSADDKIRFDAFMAEYRSIMSQSLHKKEADKPAEDLPSPEKKKAAPQKASNVEQKAEVEEKKDENWDEGITLEPESYVDPGEEDKIMVEELPEEPEPDFNLGEIIEEKEDDFQISINFDGDAPAEPKIEENEKENKYDPEKPRVVDWIFDLVEMFVFVLIAVMVLTSFIFKHSVVEGDSMLNTLEDGDHLIISDLFYAPERGDIVVFEDYSTSLKKAVVKRVIGLPGETVTVKRNVSGEYEVYINGEYLEEEYAYTEIDFTAPAEGEWIVGEGEIFVMGDNRYNSTDSRDPNVGTIDIDCILGKVVIRFLPFDKFGKVE